MALPRRDRSAAPTRLATIIALAVILAGLWMVQRRQQEATPAVVGAPAPNAAPAPAPAAETPAIETPAPAPTARAAPERPAPTDRYDLAADEARGGHTIARHVARSDAQLRERLARERISAASTYTSQALAERTVARTLAQQADRVTRWTARKGPRPNLALDYRGPRDEILGRSIRRGSADPVDCSNALVVLRWHEPRGYYVLTSYPEPAR